MSHFQRTRSEKVKNEKFYTTYRQKKFDCSSSDEFCSHCNIVFEAMGCLHHFCHCQKVRPPLTEEVIQRGSNKKILMNSEEILYKKKASLSLKSGSVIGGNRTRQLLMLSNMSEKSYLGDVK